MGDRAGEAVTLYNIAFIFAGQGRLAEAVALMEQVVAIDEEIRYPDLEKDRAALEMFRQRLQEGRQLTRSPSAQRSVFERLRKWLRGQ